MSHHAPRPEDVVLTRRELLCRSGMAMGAVALGGLLADQGRLGQAARADGTGAIPSSRFPATGALDPLAPKASPLRARAKRVVHLFMNGGPSHVDTFAPKPRPDRPNVHPV